MKKKNFIMAVIAISLGILIAMVSWLARPLAWKYTFSSSHLPACFNSANSLKFIPLIVFIAFEAMFIYTAVAPLSALIMLVAIIPVMSIRFVSVHMNIYLHIVFLTAVLGSALSLWLVKGAVHPFKINCMDRWGAMFLLYIWLLVPRSNSFRIGVKEALSLSVLFLTYFSVRFLAQNKKNIIRLSKWIAFVSGVVGVQAVMQFWFMKKGLVSLYEERFYRAYTSFGDPTQLANFFIMSAPIIGGIFYAEKKIRWLAPLSLVIPALVLTFSRSAWIAFCLALIIFILFGLKGREKIISVPLFIIMCIVFIFMSQDRYVVSDKLAPDTRIRSLYARRDIVLYSLPLIKKAPFIGIGPGNFSYINKNYDARDMVNTSIPNTYLHTLIISGIIGFCIMGLFLLLVLRTGQLYMQKGGPIFIGLYIGIVSNLIHACFENLFYNIISNWFFGLILGLLIAWQSDNEGIGRSS